MHELSGDLNVIWSWAIMPSGKLKVLQGGESNETDSQGSGGCMCSGIAGVLLCSASLGV